MTVRSIREQRGLTCEAIAALARVHFTTWARWEREGVPAARVVEVERLTGIPREQLRPDLYRTPSATAAQQDAA